MRLVEDTLAGVGANSVPMGVTPTDPCSLDTFLSLVSFFSGSSFCHLPA